jgi:cation-transporting ATPase 13A3/4/5
VPIKVIPYPYPLSTVFPQAIPPGASTSRAASVRGTASVPIAPVHALNGEQPGGVGAAKDLMHDVERGNTTWEETMGYLKVMEYRYTKFALEPGTGRWAMIR